MCLVDFLYRRGQSGNEEHNCRGVLLPHGRANIPSWALRGRYRGSKDGAGCSYFTTDGTWAVEEDSLWQWRYCDESQEVRQFLLL